LPIWPLYVFGLLILIALPLMARDKDTRWKIALSQAVPLLVLDVLLIIVFTVTLPRNAAQLLLMLGAIMLYVFGKNITAHIEEVGPARRAAWRAKHQ